MMNRKEELDQFKRINLGEYAESRGFVHDRRASSRHSLVVRHPRGDKLIISRDASGVYYYFNAKGDDSGTIVDLVASLDGANLGEVRQILRGYTGDYQRPPSSPSLPMNVEPASHNSAGVLRAWMKMADVADGHPYLTKHRGISVDVQTDPIFQGRIRIDDRGNAVFPHFGPGNIGLCGYESKNGNAGGTTFTGFAPGGLKALHCSRPREDDREAILCETAVDMLSVATLEGTEGRRFFSTAGQISSLQAECLRSAASRMPAGSRVVIATDNDEGGRMLATKIEDALRTIDIPTVRHHPAITGDWNDVLLQTRQTDEPQPRFE